MIAVCQIIKKVLGFNPKKIKPLFGGDSNKVYHFSLKNQEFVIKLNIKNNYSKIFEKEKQGLELLSNSKFRIPNVISCGSFESYDYLILEYIKAGKEINWEIFGKNLANLHQITNQEFGLDYNNYIGSIQQINNYENNWEEFYANHRILKLTTLARDKQLLNRNECKMIEQLCNKLKNFVPKNKPCLVHGDLWSGNLICDMKNNPVLIDPAVYYGHPEMDWAMLSLFGSYPSIAFESYNEDNTIEKGFEQRKEIHQLYPLLVHLIIFGKGYYNSIIKIVNKFS